MKRKTVKTALRGFFDGPAGWAVFVPFLSKKADYDRIINDKEGVFSMKRAVSCPFCGVWSFGGVMIWISTWKR